MMAPRSEDDAALMRAARDDPECFGKIFDRHFVTVFRFCGRRVGTDLGEDLAGDTFRRAFEARYSYDLSQPNALPWLYRIALNLVRDAIRSKTAEDCAYARLRALAWSGSLSEEYHTPERAEARADLKRLARLLVAESQEDVEALFLHVWDGLSYADVATAMRLPVGTVRSRLSRLRYRLETAMGNQAGDSHEIHQEAKE
jgi:RNA polymerase sigma factor (sigma-70 family)